MSNLNENEIEELERILSSKLGKNIKIREITEIETGYHSEGFKILTNEDKQFFLKRIKSHDVGFEFPERRLVSLLISHSMANRLNHNSNINSLGVFVQNKYKKIDIIPKINENTEIYQIQKFGGEGKSYLKILDEKNKIFKSEDFLLQEINSQIFIYFNLMP